MSEIVYRSFDAIAATLRAWYFFIVKHLLTGDFINWSLTPSLRNKCYVWAIKIVFDSLKLFEARNLKAQVWARKIFKRFLFKIKIKVSAYSQRNRNRNKGKNKFHSMIFDLVKWVFIVYWSQLLNCFSFYFSPLSPFFNTIFHTKFLCYTLRIHTRLCKRVLCRHLLFIDQDWSLEKSIESQFLLFIRHTQTQH